MDSRMQTRRVVPAAGHGPSLITGSAVAGIAGPILFTVAFVVQDMVRSGERDAITEPVSALEAGAGGWVQQVNFVVFGLLTIAFAIGLHRGVRAARAGWAGPALLVLSGLALLWAAAFPLREDAAGVLLPPGLHLVGGMTYFASAALGLVVVSRRVAADPRWRDLAGYTLAAGVVAVAAFPVMGLLVQPDDAPLHPWFGLAQRALVVAVLAPPTVALAIRLLRVARAPVEPSPVDGTRR